MWVNAPQIRDKTGIRVGETGGRAFCTLNNTEAKRKHISVLIGAVT